MKEKILEALTEQFVIDLMKEFGTDYKRTGKDIRFLPVCHGDGAAVHLHPALSSQSEGSSADPQRLMGPAPEQHHPLQGILVRHKRHWTGSLGENLGRHPYLAVHRLCRCRGGGHCGHPRGRALGLCPQAGLLLHRAV